MNLAEFHWRKYQIEIHTPPTNEVVEGANTEVLAEVDNTNKFGDHLVIETLATYQYTISGLTKTKRYFVRLFAYNARGDSAACDKTGLNCDGNRLSGIPDGNP